jgi:hypothetical protein
MATFGGSNIVTDGLVLWLDAANKKSYPGSGTSWLDLSGNNNSGTLTNGPTFSSASNGSIVFDGVDDFVNILDIGSGSIFQTQNFTISCWVNITSYTNRDSTLWDWGFSSHVNPYYCQHFRVQWISGTPALFAGWNESGNYTINSSFNTAGFNDQSLNYALSAGPHNVVWTRSLIGSAFYVDGSLICTKTISNTINYYNTPVRLGKTNYTNPNSYFIGNYYSSKFYNKVLSAQEVQQNYDALKSRYLNIY